MSTNVESLVQPTPTHVNQIERRPVDHPPVKLGKVGLLLVNLGTPDATDFWSIRRYLKEFLSDRRVIEVHPLLWKLVLNLVILNVRPGKAAKAYRKIWVKESNESPLRLITRQQAEKLGRTLHASTEQCHAVEVEWAMRYGNPSIASKMTALQKRGCDRIVVMPLYPQYSATTTATVVDALYRHLAQLRWQPAVRIVEPYYAHEAYIDALAQSYRDHIASLSWQPEVLLTSFHGLPKRYHDKGDPYYCHCHKTARLLRQALNMSEADLQLGFQSRFGPDDWLQPYMTDLLDQLIEKGITKVAVMTPGFAADCVETLEEINIELRAHFLQQGGAEFTLVPALNDSERGISMLQRLATQALAGWG